MHPTVTAFLRLRSLPRRDGLDDRATVLSLFARFVDELGSGLLVVLMPTLRTRLGLSVEQVAWCFQALATVGAAYGPLANTAGVVLIEGHPDAVGRISGRATVVDTAGALLAPVAVAVVVWGGIDRRGLLAPSRGSRSWATPWRCRVR